MANCSLLFLSIACDLTTLPLLVAATRQSWLPSVPRNKEEKTKLSEERYVRVQCHSIAETARDGTDTYGLWTDSLYSLLTTAPKCDPNLKLFHTSHYTEVMDKRNSDVN